MQCAFPLEIVGHGPEGVRGALFDSVTHPSCPVAELMSCLVVSTAPKALENVGKVGWDEKGV